MGMLIYWLVFLQKSWCLAFVENGAGVCVILPMCSSDFCESVPLPFSLSSGSPRSGLSSRPSRGNEGHVALPAHRSLALVLTRMEVRSCMEVLELRRHFLEENCGRVTDSWTGTP